MAVNRRAANGRITDTAVWRLLDANVNRAREGLRIVEDTARFILNKPKAAKDFRVMRHELDALARIHYRTLLAARNVDQDSGKTNRASGYQGNIQALLAANFKRCEEALRVVEEYGRILSPRTVEKAQRLRFKIYHWEKTLSRCDNE